MGQSPNDAGIGVVDFLGALLPDFNFDLMQNLPWTRVKMNDSTIEYGSIK